MSFFFCSCKQLSIAPFFFSDTFRKLRAKYLELKKQQMVQLKANLKERGVPNALSGLTKREWKRKRGRSRVNSFVPLHTLFFFGLINFDLTFLIRI